LTNAIRFVEVVVGQINDRFANRFVALRMPKETKMPPEQKKQIRPEDRLGAERADIARRVANFKAHQARLEQERDAYYKSVRARIDKTLGTSPPRDPSI
jgi:hypothetical protein